MSRRSLFWPSNSVATPSTCGAKGVRRGPRAATPSTTWATIWSGFIDQVIGRPTVVSGLSSGGVLAAWLSAYAKPGQVLGAHYEDPPLFHCEAHPEVGQGIDRGIGRMFAVSSKYLGDQWSVGDTEGMAANFA